jgi:hypothetical protein
MSEADVAETLAFNSISSLYADAGPSIVIRDETVHPQTRVIALQAALATRNLATAPPNEILAAARKYYAFLMGDK